MHIATYIKTKVSADRVKVTVGGGKARLGLVESMLGIEYQSESLK